jgi:hypothetical protein
MINVPSEGYRKIKQFTFNSSGFLVKPHRCVAVKKKHSRLSL